jgi:type II secretory pathway component GspD/PulD (secretin)
VRRNVAAAAILILALGTSGRAQEQKPAAASPTTLRVQLVLSRYQGDKKISSLPYTLTVNAAERTTGRSSLRLGTQVPITTMSRQGSDANAPMVPAVQYRDIGTNIDCLAATLDDGRFKLDLTVEDSSLDTEARSGANGTHPAFRSFRTIDSVILRDGQTAQYSTATDKVSGEVWKVDVTLTVVK